MSSQWEHTISNGIEEETGDEYKSYRCGYSGNSKHPQPDVHVAGPMQNYDMELKGPIKRDVCYVEEDDIDQLVECQNAQTAVYLVIKFQRREPLVVRYWEDLTTDQTSVAGLPDDYEDLSKAEKFAAVIPGAFDPRVTDSGTLALSKPSTDDWPSAKAGSDDVDAIISGVGIVTESSVEVDF